MTVKSMCISTLGELTSSMSDFAWSIGIPNTNTCHRRRLFHLHSFGCILLWMIQSQCIAHSFHFGLSGIKKWYLNQNAFGMKSFEHDSSNNCRLLFWMWSQIKMPQNRMRHWSKYQWTIPYETSTVADIAINVISFQCTTWFSQREDNPIKHKFGENLVWEVHFRQFADDVWVEWPKPMQTLTQQLNILLSGFDTLCDWSEHRITLRPHNMIIILHMNNSTFDSLSLFRFS